MAREIFNEMGRGLQRFWGLSWWIKGPILAFVALIAIAGISSLAGGGSDENGEPAGSPLPSATLQAPSPSAAPSVVPTSSPSPSAAQSPAPEASPTPVLATAQPTAQPPVPTQPPGAASCTSTASVDNPAPAQNATVTVTGVLSCTGISPEGAAMHAVWHYKSTDSTCDAVTDSSGTAACSREIGRATVGFTVDIAVTITLAGKSYSAQTSFTPQ